VNFGGKEKSQHKVKIVWQIDEDRDDGKRFCVRKRYTLSLHEKSTLRKDLESWRGRPFTPAELEGFDLEVLLGVPCLLSVMHAIKPEGNTWANVAAIMKLPKTMQAIQVSDYVRECDRKEGSESIGDHVPETDMGITDDDVPF
jgi:hypothetical protein